MAETAAEIRRLLEEAASGLVYSSEGDHPFAFVELPAAPWPPTPEAFRALVGAPPEAGAEEVPLGRFLQHHTDCTDPYDVRAQEIRPRYERLQALLSSHLADLRVFRIGEVRIDCWLVGRGPGGRPMGLRTIAIET